MAGLRMIRPRHIDKAARRINPHILQTPLIRSRWLSERCGGEVLLKLESEQYTGSFKARGSLNKLMWLKDKPSSRLPVTASTGNHGLGFARALNLLGIKGLIFLPENAVISKVNAIRAYGADIQFYGTDPYDTEMHARSKAQEQGWEYISPYNDEQVIAGQGTIGKEILKQTTEIDTLIATVGGGGLISGIATYMRSQLPEIDIIGCQPENSPEMSVSVRAGKYKEVETEPTLSDGSAGGFERDAITFDLCRKLVDDFVLITEEEIKDGIRGMIRHHSKLVEGSAAVAVASILKEPQKYKNKRTVVVVCGANIAEEKLRDILQP